MVVFASPPTLLALHAVRVLGAPTVEAAAALYDLDPQATGEDLLDAQAVGWITKHDWFGTITWSLTSRGKDENERQLADELDKAGARTTVATAHQAFLPLNRRLGSACTRWQLNAHLDDRVNATVLRELTSIAKGVDGVCSTLSSALDRFSVHAPRFHEALDRVLGGDSAWLDAPDRPSCHLVWISLHEDLLATLGIERGTDDLEVTTPTN